MCYIHNDRHYYSIYAGWLGCVCRRVSSNGGQRSFPHEGCGSLCCISLFAEAGCSEGFADTGEDIAMPELIETLVLGGGNGGMFLAWHMARSGRRTAVVERRWIGGSCPNINCLPSKNEIWSAKVANLVHHAASFGAK